MNLLEVRYRRVPRLLPASYRAEREEEMVAAFLDGAADADGIDDADSARPSWPEIASVAALAIRVRLGGVGAPPRSRAWGEGVRLAAWLGLLVQAVLSCLSVGGALRLYGVLGPASGIDAEKIIGPAGSVERLGHLAGGVAALAWIAAYLTLVHGHRHAAKVLAVLAIIPAACQSVADIATVLRAPPFRPAETWPTLSTGASYLLLTIVPVLALLAGFHQDAPAMRRPSRPVVPLVCMAVSALVAISLGVLITQPGLDARLWPWIDPGGVFCLLVLLVGLGYTGVYLFAPGHRTPSWPLALMILLVPAITTRIATMFTYSSSTALTDQSGTVMLAIQIITAVVMALLLLVLGAQTLRRLPSSPSPP